jgi:hypothetical protein
VDIFGFGFGQQSRRPRELEYLLANIPTGLAAVYDQMLGPVYHLDSLENRLHDLKWQILHIIIAAARPLNLEGLNWALNINAGDRSEDDVLANLFFDISEVIKECGSFIQITNSQVGLVHLTARDYLVKVRDDFAKKIRHGSIVWIRQSRT